MMHETSCSSHVMLWVKCFRVTVCTCAMMMKMTTKEWEIIEGCEFNSTPTNDDCMSESAESTSVCL